MITRLLKNSDGRNLSELSIYPELYENILTKTRNGIIKKLETAKKIIKVDV